MRGNRRWYGGPVWALVMLLALVVAGFAPVVLAEPATPGVEVPEQETSAPEVQIEAGVPVEEPAPETGGGDPAPAGETGDPSANDLASEPDDPIQEVPGEEGMSTETTGDPTVDLTGDEGELEPTEAVEDERAGPVMSLLAAPADISVTLAAEYADIAPGGTMIYTMQVTNNGTETAENVSIWLELAWFSATGWTYSYVSTLPGVSAASCSDELFEGTYTHIDCEVAGLQPGMTATFGMLSHTDAADMEEYCGAALSATAAVTSVDGSPGAAMAGPVYTMVTCEDAPEPASDIGISLVGPASVGIGGTLGYMMTVTNTGDATAGEVRFALAAEMETQAAWTPSVISSQAGSVTCNYSAPTRLTLCIAISVEPGDVIVVATSSPTDQIDLALCGTSVTERANVIWVDGVTGQSGWTSNGVTTGVVCGAEVGDIAMALSGPSVVQRGETFTYEMTITNTDDMVANEIRTSATLQNTGANWTGTLVGANPAIGTFPGDGGSCSFAGVSLACTIFGLEPGGSVTIAMSSPTSNLDDLFCATSRNQTASIAWVDGQTPGATSNAVVTDIDCGAEPEDMSIALTGDTLVNRGDTVSYTMVVSNNGDEVANEVRFTTAGLPFTGSDWTWSVDDQASPGLGDGCNPIPSFPPIVACTFHAIAPGESVAVTVESSTASMDEAACDSTWEQLASVVWVDGQVISATWSNVVTTEFICAGPEPEHPDELVLEKTGPASIERGDSLWYEITVTNVSDQIVTFNLFDAELPDTTGYDWSVVSYTGSHCEIYTGSGAAMMRCLDVELDPGETKSVRVESVGTDPEAQTCEIDNQAYAGSINGEWWVSVNSNTATTVVEDCGEPSPTVPATATVPATPAQTATATVDPTSTATTPATPGTPPATPGTPLATPTATATVPATPTSTATAPATPTPTVDPTASPTATATGEPTAAPTATGIATVPPTDPAPATQTATAPVEPVAPDSTTVAALPGTGTTPGGTSSGDDGKPVADLPVTGQGASASGTSLTPFLLLVAVLLAAVGHRVRTMPADSRRRR